MKRQLAAALLMTTVFASCYHYAPPMIPQQADAIVAAARPFAEPSPDACWTDNSNCGIRVATSPDGKTVIGYYAVGYHKGTAPDRIIPLAVTLPSATEDQ